MMTTGAVLDGGFAEGAGDWAFAARRGNMDLFFDLVDSPLGEPEYSDYYAHVGRRLNDWLAISANALAFDDRILAFDSDQEEEARAEYEDRYYWLRADMGAADGLGGRVLAGQTRIASERSGSADLPGVGSGVLSDSRDFTINSIQADGWWRIGARSLLQAGLEWREQSGRYDYEDEAEFELLFLTPGAATTPERSRSLHLRPDGQQYGAYLNWRLEFTPAVASDLGVRFDRSTLAESDPSHWSPRAVLMWRPGDRTRLRLGWGQYYQTQGINELQVPDGESAYQRAQRATHAVASVERDLSRALTLRLEAYRKEYDHPFVRHENLLNTVVVLPELKPDRIRVAPDAAVAEGAEISLKYDAGRFSGWASYTHSRVRDRVEGEWQARNWDQRDLRDRRTCLEWRPLGSLARDHLAQRLADDRGRAPDARAVPPGRNRQAQCGERRQLLAHRRPRRAPLRPRFGRRAHRLRRGEQPDETQQRLLRRIPAGGRGGGRGLPRRRSARIAAADPVHRRPVALLTEGTLTFRKR